MTTYFLNDSAYTVCKWVALILLPALGTFYGALSALWALPYGSEVAQTCQILALFLGSLIGISQASARKED